MAENPLPQCPGCGNTDTHQLGSIPAANCFAGRQLDRELAGGALWKCGYCNLAFRFPRMDKAEMDQLYRAGSDGSWVSPVTQRTDWQLAKQWLENQPGIRRVLDVGCFDGRLLEYLGSNYQAFGVEIHPTAAKSAVLRGVQIVASDFNDLARLEINADVAFAVDVIEHAFDPGSFLKAMVAAVRPGGWIILTTGNTDAPSWRLMKGRYWYCHVAEHVSFVNPPWVKAVSEKLGLDVVTMQPFSHAGGHGGIKQKLYEFAGNLLLKVAPKLFSYLRRHGFGAIDLDRFPGLEFAPPYWMTARDHLFLVLQKKTAME